MPKQKSSVYDELRAKNGDLSIELNAAYERAKNQKELIEKLQLDLDKQKLAHNMALAERNEAVIKLQKELAQQKGLTVEGHKQYEIVRRERDAIALLRDEYHGTILTLAALLAAKPRVQQMFMGIDWSKGFSPTPESLLEQLGDQVDRVAGKAWALKVERSEDGRKP